MSRTFRKDRRTGKKVNDGKIAYRCKCEVCSSVIKNKLQSEACDEMIKEYLDL